MSVWDDLVGQDKAIETLRRAVESGRPGHAWLITGPPGSGRSNAARAFAAALQCSRDGCGVCDDCRTAMAGSHPDVTLMRTEHLSIRVSEVRELVRHASMRPMRGRFCAQVVEDADRLTEQAADALLKSIEEPAPTTVWLLCAPAGEDVPVTIRSRCRSLVLRTPPTDAVAAMLIDRDGVDPAMATFAARASQGHIGRARALARDEDVRRRRHEVLSVPARLADLGSCLASAQNLVSAATEEAKALAAPLDKAEREQLETSVGLGTRGVRPREATAALKELEDDQKTRVKRFERDALDRELIDLIGYYRDVLVLQTVTSAGAQPKLVNAEQRETMDRLAHRTSAAQTLQRIAAIDAARTKLTENVAPLLAVEAMMIELVAPTR